MSEPELEQPTSTIPASATALTVHLRVASGLLPADLNGYSDPFVKLHLGPTVVRSTMQRKTLNPVFNEELRLPIAAAAKT